MRRALFFPWSAGGGSGYTCRCLAVATRVASTYRCAFGPEAIPSLIDDAGFQLVGPRARWHSTAPQHDYLPFANVERVYAVTARYFRAQRIREHVERDRAAIAEYRPELVVVDMQPTAAIAARSLGLPLISLADADFLSPSSSAWMPWLTLAPDALIPHPSCLPAFNEVLEGLALDSIDSVTELLWGDVTLVPSSAELEPVVRPPAGRSAAVHVGPLYWDPPRAKPVLPQDADSARVYVTIGSGGMISDRVMRRVLDALAQARLSVFVSTGIGSRTGLSHAANIHYGGFTGLTEAIRWSDVVVTHGGYSSVLATISLGRPQAVIPLMSEQEANGRELVERPGCGLLIRSTRTDGDKRALRFRNRFSGESDSAVPEHRDVLGTVNALLHDESWRERTTRMSETLARARADTDLLTLFDTTQT
jgi:UDP:flavonoid glycosyltransferase YjiC (YdhE family)